jgi:hypothetical protein
VDHGADVDYSDKKQSSWLCRKSNPCSAARTTWNILTHCREQQPLL